MPVQLEGETMYVGLTLGCKEGFKFFILNAKVLCKMGEKFNNEM